MSRKKLGICQLTGEHGIFVKCHIIPKALTRPTVKGAPLMQSSFGKGIKKRWDSWYDQKLVIRKGEDYFSAIDDSAIRVLKQNQLIWSSWETDKLDYEDFSSFSKIQDPKRQGIKNLSLQPEDAKALVLFFYSILWRASVSKMRDMQYISLSEDEENTIKEMILGNREVDPTFLPISLTRLSTRVDRYNKTPTKDIKITPEIGNEPSKEITFYRLFIDGLIVHVNQHDEPLPSRGEKISNFLAYTPELLTHCIDFEVSDEKQRLIASLEETRITDI